jgi:molecular chaperone GrpE
MARMPDQNKHSDEPDRPIIRDKRRIDPVTGQQRDPDPDRPASGDPGAHPVAQSEDVVALEAAVAERTADLQRLQAEYANYRKRVERDRVTVRDLAVRDVLVALLPILDDVDRARSHDDLTGAFKVVADQLDTTLTKVGLESFGEEGDAFDPAVHEAVTHAESDDVAAPTVTAVMRRGYRYADRLVRPAMVGVSEPAHVSATTDELAADDSPTE